MTREEAIKYLEQHKYANTCGQKSLEESNEAIDMAIEALSAEAPKPTGELIEKADAIEAVMAEGRKVYTSEYANAERVIYEADAVEALSMLPPANTVEVKAEQLPPKVPTEWINDGMVLVPQHDWVEMQKKIEEYASADVTETDGVITIEKQSAKDVGEIKHIVVCSPNCTRYFYNESMPIPSDEAVQGEWVRKYDDKINSYWYECDQCGSRPPRNEFTKQEWLSNFCPNCGAKMSKGGDDE